MGVRKIRTYGGKIRWQVDYGLKDGKRHRVSFEKKAHAETAWKNHCAEREGFGHAWAALSAGERVEAAQVIAKAKAEGLTLEKLWGFWQSNKARRSGRTLGECCTEFAAAREGSGLTKHYLDQLRSYLRGFALDRENIDIADVNLPMLDEWFAARKESPWTRQSGINRISALFEFCIRRGYVTDNPTKRIERVRLPDGKRDMLSVDQCQSLVRSAHEIDRGLLTYLALALFCGIRPEEAKRVTKKDIDLDGGVVTLEAAKTKVRNIRFVKLLEPAKLCLRAGEPFEKTNFRRRFDALRKHAGIANWPHDVMRKTAASHLYNIYGIDKATEQLGHSATMMLKVYRNLVSEADTQAWLAIVPVPLRVAETG